MLCRSFHLCRTTITLHPLEAACVGLPLRTLGMGTVHSLRRGHRPRGLVDSEARLVALSSCVAEFIIYPPAGRRIDRRVWFWSRWKGTKSHSLITFALAERYVFTCETSTAFLSGHVIDRRSFVVCAREVRCQWLSGLVDFVAVSVFRVCAIGVVVCSVTSCKDRVACGFQVCTL